MNICIVDDIPADLMREKEVLKKSLPDASFHCVGNSAEVTDFSLYDVFFLDIDLHGESGIHLAERIHTVYPMKPVIFISGHNDLFFSSLKVSPVFFNELPRGKPQTSTGRLTARQARGRGIFNASLNDGPILSNTTVHMNLVYLDS